jgi:hypothetical protein
VLLNKFCSLSESCWFCLASTAVEKHLIISIGSEVGQVAQNIVLSLLLLLLEQCETVSLHNWTTNRPMLVLHMVHE